MSRYLKITLLGALVLIAMLIWLFRAPVETVFVDTGPSWEAIRNPYLGMEMYLKKLNHPVSTTISANVVKKLAPEANTLILFRNYSIKDSREADAVMEWVNKGGHLIIVARHFWEADKTEEPDKEDGDDEDSSLYNPEDEFKTQETSRDRLLDHLGIRLLRTDSLESPPAKYADQLSQDKSPELTKLYLEGSSWPAMLSFDTQRHLEDTRNRAYIWANSADATHLLQIRQGKGLVTVMSDGRLWDNNNIAKHDNAWLLSYLTEKDAITLVSNAHRPSYDGFGPHPLSIFWQYFPLACLILALLLLALFWHVGLRSGPILFLHRRVPQQLSKYLYASATFTARYSSQAILIRELQKDIHRQARFISPGFRQLLVDQQWQVLSRLSGRPREEVSRLMRPLPDKPISQVQFVRIVANLQTLRNAL